METFTDWLLNEMNKREWSQAELARKCNTTTATISRIINGERRIGNDIATAIAQAFHIPADEVFRQAGLLPPQPDTDPVLDELNYKLASLPIELREEALEYLNYLIEKQDRKARGKNGLKNNLGTTHAT